MRVLHVNDTLVQRGGVERYLAGLLPALRGRGVHCEVVSADADAPSDLAGAPAHAAPRGRAKGEVEAWLKTIVARVDPDVVHVHNWLAGTAEPLFDRPVVRTFHDHRTTCAGGARYLPRIGATCEREHGPVCLASAYALGCNMQRPRAVAASYRQVGEEIRDYPRYHALITASGMVRDVLVRHGATRERTHVIPYFPQIEPIEGDPEPGTLLFAGRIVREKGLDTAIRALPDMPARARLLVAGEGRALPDALHLADRLGVRERVQTLGWADPSALARLYARTEITLFPSLWPEPFGIVGIEAMATGRPVVASDVGGVRTWLADGETGSLHAPGDAVGLAHAATALLEDAPLRRRMGEAARARATKDFGREAHLDALTAVYDRAGREALAA